MTWCIFRQALRATTALAALCPPAWGQTAPKPIPLAASKPTAPAARLEYELLAPEGKDLKNLPAVIYLHPSEQPRLEQARSEYWPVLKDLKCLMVLPRSRGAKMWLSGEDKGVLDVLADVQTRHRVDDKRIILLGVSGGGQLALFLADHYPGKFRAVVAVAVSPVVVRGDKSEWFYPARQTLKSCPYLAINHITQGSALMYWRQVQAKLAPAGASISILPVTGDQTEYLPPPKEFSAWLAEVLAGKQPQPLPDPQKLAVAKMFAAVAEDLPKAIEKASLASSGQVVSKDGPAGRLALLAPFDFDRAKAEDAVDSAGRPLTQIRLEHKKWPIVIRADARATDKPLAEILAVEEADTIARGLLYQVYKTGQVSSGQRTWQYKIGSLTYPDRARGWVSVLFLHASAAVDKEGGTGFQPVRATPGSQPVRGGPRTSAAVEPGFRWLSVLLSDETQQPDAAELAGCFRAALGSLSAAPPASAPATRHR